MLPRKHVFVAKTTIAKAHRAARSQYRPIWIGTFKTLAFFMCSAVTSCSNPDALSSTEETDVKNISSGRLGLTMLEVTGQNLLTEQASEKTEMETALKSAQAIMKNVLFDPGAAEYQGVRLGRGGSICGKLNGKNRMGAYIGFKDFVITGTKEALFSPSNNGIAFASMTPFALAYAQGCASKQESEFFYSSNRPAETTTSSDSTWTEPPLQADEPDAVLDAPPKEEAPQSDAEPDA